MGPSLVTLMVLGLWGATKWVLVTLMVLGLWGAIKWGPSLVTLMVLGSWSSENGVLVWLRCWCWGFGVREMGSYSFVTLMVL